MAENPFLITIYDKTFARVGWIGAPMSVTATPRHNLVSSCQFTIEADNPRINDLIAPGARVVISYYGDTLMSGPVRLQSGSGPLLESTVTFSVESDDRSLYAMLAWPVPANALSLQNVSHYSATGNLETVVKNLVSANATRLGRPITMATNQNRGPTVSVKLRFDVIAEAIIPMLEVAGYGLTMEQSGSGIVLDLYQPSTVPQQLSEESGVLVDWEWSQSAPAATRVVVGGQGDLTARTFLQVTDTTLESEWGDKLEVFRDARDADNTDLLTARGNEALLDGAPKAGLRLTLAETNTWRYGRNVVVGDIVTVAVAPGVTVTDVLREAQIKWTSENGLEVQPVVGERTDDPSRVLAKAVAAIARGVRNVTAGR